MKRFEQFVSEGSAQDRFNKRLKKSHGIDLDAKEKMYKAMADKYKKSIAAKDKKSTIGEAYRAKKLPGRSRYEYRGYEIEKMSNGWHVTPPGETGSSDVERSKKEAMELVDRYEGK